MKTILYYITDHGLGHASRSVAIIRELQKQGINVIIRNSNNINFLKKSLPATKIIPGISDVGPVISKDGISIDLAQSKRLIHNWLDSIDDTIKKEQTIIKDSEPDLIISDISAAPVLASHISKIPSITISNFCWSDVLNFIDSEKLSKLISIYELADFAIQLPFGTSMKPFKKKQKVGIVCKSPTRTKQKVCNMLNVDKNSYKVFVNLNNQYHIALKKITPIQVISTGAFIQPSNKKIAPWIEGQDLISISDLVICKLGYGMVSECITNGVPFVYLSDPKHQEQNFIEKDLKKLGIDNRITKDDLHNLDLNQLNKRCVSPIKHQNDTHTAIRLILQMF